MHVYFGEFCLAKVREMHHYQKFLRNSVQTCIADLNYSTVAKSLDLE